MQQILKLAEESLTIRAILNLRPDESAVDHVHKAAQQKAIESPQLEKLQDEINRLSLIIKNPETELGRYASLGSYENIAKALEEAQKAGLENQAYRAQLFEKRNSEKQSEPESVSSDSKGDVTLELKSYREMGTVEEVNEALDQFSETLTKYNVILEKSKSQAQEIESLRAEVLSAVDSPRLTEEDKVEINKSVAILRDLRQKLDWDEDVNILQEIQSFQSKIARLMKDAELHASDVRRVSTIIEIFRIDGVRATRTNIQKLTTSALDFIKNKEALKAAFNGSYDPKLAEQNQEASE